MLKRILVWASWIISGFGFFSPILAEMLKRWLDRNGYLDHPDEGFAWALSKIISITDWWLFYPLVCLILGFAIGLSVDTWMRRISNDRETKLSLLGYDMQDMQSRIKGRDPLYGGWPKCCGDLIPSIQSLLLTADNLGIPAPDKDRIFKIAKGREFLIYYFGFVGSYLINGHIEVAKEKASQVVYEVASQPV